MQVEETRGLCVTSSSSQRSTKAGTKKQKTCQRMKARLQKSNPGSRCKKKTMEEWSLTRKEKKTSHRLHAIQDLTKRNDLMRYQETQI